MDAVLFGTRPVAQVILAVVFLFVSIHSAYALDPRKPLTQYLHAAWQVEDGLPQNTINDRADARWLHLVHDE